MNSVLDFIKFACSHASPKSVPKGADIPYPVGTDGVWQYLWGTKGQTVTQGLLDARYESYYRVNGWSRAEFDTVTRGWVANKVRVTDCQGYLDSYLKNDTTANGNFKNYCTDKGLISAINRPFVIGEAVFNGSDTKKTHVGWVCGFLGSDPLVVEARGLKYGVVITRMSARQWKYRGLMTKKFTYEDPKPEPQPDPSVYVFHRPMRYGDVGDDVIKLKELLFDKGYKMDGVTTNTANSKNFGGKTRTLVKEFQRDNGLTVDGIAGRNTITALGGVYR